MAGSKLLFELQPKTHVRACRLKRRTATVVLNNNVVLNNEVLGLVDYQVHHVQCTELRA